MWTFPIFFTFYPNCFQKLILKSENFRIYKIKSNSQFSSLRFQDLLEILMNHCAHMEFWKRKKRHISFYRSPFRENSSQKIQNFNYKNGLFVLNRSISVFSSMFTFGAARLYAREMQYSRRINIKIGKDATVVAIICIRVCVCVCVLLHLNNSAYREK